MRIAFFEDNNEHAHRIEESINIWAERNDRKVAVTRYASAFEAKDLFVFDCILLDVEMPGMDGALMKQATGDDSGEYRAYYQRMYGGR